MLPKGKVWLYLDGIGRRELICDSLVGKEVEVSLKDFDKEGGMSIIRHLMPFVKLDSMMIRKL